MVELKKCPCCGKAANVWERFGVATRPIKYVACGTCGLRTELYQTEEQAAEAWNRRTPPAEG